MKQLSHEFINTFLTFQDIISRELKRFAGRGKVQLHLAKPLLGRADVSFHFPKVALSGIQLLYI